MYVPFAHGTHASTLVASADGLLVPAAHDAHDAKSSARYWPAWHSVHTLEPVGAAQPSKHVRHDCAATVSEYVPASHARHAEPNASMCVPGWHFWHELEPATDPQPTAHALHVDA